MIIGVPREIKDNEYRVGMTPAGVKTLIQSGNKVLVEASAGIGSGFEDKDYIDAGASITSAPDIYSSADMIVKVKEPLASEYAMLREGQILFTYLHLAPNIELTDALIDKKVIAIAYETIEKDGRLPLLAPMSEIAGRMSVLIGAYYLQRPEGGMGLLCTGMPGVCPAKVVILGAGNVGSSAARVAIGLGCQVVVMNRGIERLHAIDELFQGRVMTLSMDNIDKEVKEADVLIGAVLIPGSRTPRLVTRQMVSKMKRGSVIVDVSVDQGGCIETTRPTTHSNPVYEVHAVIHYCVTNMPGAFPRTSTLVLTNCTISYIAEIASMGFERAVRKDDSLYKGVNLYRGAVIHPALASSIGVEPGVIR